MNSYSDAEKRARTPNFSATEKQVLLSIIHRYKHIVENKKTDAVSNDAKNEAWSKITQDFNSTCPDMRHRTTPCLKKFYNNKKKEIRKEVAVENKQRVLTGGGGVAPLRDIEEKELLLGLMNPKTVYGLSNEFDSDQPLMSVITEYDIEEDDEENEDIRCNRSYGKGKTFVRGEGDIHNLVAIKAALYNLCLSACLLDTFYCWNGVVNRKSNNAFAMLYVYNIIHNRAIEMFVLFQATEEAEYVPKRQKVDSVIEEPTPSCSGMQSIWKRVTPTILSTPLSTPLKAGNFVRQETPRKVPDPSRRRPTTVIKALTSSSIAEKYDMLVERRLAIANMEAKEIEERVQWQQKMQQEQLQKIQLEKEKVELEKESLQLDIKIKKEQLRVLKM